MINPKINSQIYERLEIFMQKNQFCITENYFYNSKPGQFMLKIGNPTITLKNMSFFSNSAIYKVADSPPDLYRIFTDKLEEEILSWPDELYINLYTFSTNADINSILHRTENAFKFVTLPEVLDNTTEKTIKKYSKNIKNEEQFTLYFEKIINHPYWSDKEEFLKKFLQDTKHIPTFNYFFHKEKIEDIQPIESPSTATYEINFHLMPTYEQVKGAKPHTASSQNLFIIKMIRDFHTYNTVDSFVNGIYASHVNPSNGIKQITVLAKNESIAHVFAQEFIELFKQHLRDNPHVGENSSTGFSSDNMEEILKKVQICALQHQLDKTLKTNQDNKKNKI